MCSFLPAGIRRSVPLYGGVPKFHQLLNQARLVARCLFLLLRNARGVVGRMQSSILLKAIRAPCFPALHWRPNDINLYRINLSSVFCEV